MPDPTFQPRTTLLIEAAANGFIVREPHQIGRPPGQALVFNHLGAGLLAFLEQHFESEADRERRVQQAQMDLEMQRTHLECIAGLTHGGPIGPAPFAGFPPITGCNPAPFDGSLLKTEPRAYACSARANGLPLCRKWCGNEVLCSAASSDAGSPT
jgi:hypothetical protein